MTPQHPPAPTRPPLEWVQYTKLPGGAALRRWLVGRALERHGGGVDHTEALVAAGKVEARVTRRGALVFLTAFALGVHAAVGQRAEALLAAGLVGILVVALASALRASVQGVVLGVGPVLVEERRPLRHRYDAAGGADPSDPERLIVRHENGRIRPMPLDAPGGVPLTFLRRGIFDRQPMALLSHDPLGLVVVRATQWVRFDPHAYVGPPLAPRTEAVDRIVAAALAHVDDLPLPQPWRPGDPGGRPHRAATARTGTPHVLAGRPGITTVRLVLGLVPEGAEAEAVVRAARTVGEALLERGTDLQVVAAWEGSIHVAGVRDVDGLFRALCTADGSAWPGEEHLGGGDVSVVALGVRRATLVNGVALDGLVSR